MDSKYASSLISKIRQNIEKIIIGKTKEVEIVLAAFVSGGHVLLEDVPGTGKTMLAKALAKSINVNFSRIQFTPDLLPSDIIGINFFNPKTSEFILKRGAVFTNILLADEINRATPRTQSALLESMEERQTTIDGETHKLNPPYFVIATQNPVETQGTFPLPEAQLDRFLIKLSLGYPSKDETIEILKLFGKENKLNSLEPVISSDEFLKLQSEIKDVFINEDMLAYIVDLAEKTRLHQHIQLGVSVRGVLSLMNICKAYAVIKDRSYVTPDDVQTLLPYVFSHRMLYKGGLRYNSSEIIEEIIKSVAPPVENWDKNL